MPPLRRHATLLLTLLALGTPAAAVAQDPSELPPVTSTPQTQPDPDPVEPDPEPEPAPEPDPEPAEPDPAPRDDEARELPNTGADADAIALLGGAVVLVGFGLRLRTVPARF